MIDPAQFVGWLDELGLSMYVGVPDSLLKEFGQHVMATLPQSQHVIAANEGAAVGTALGHYLASGRPAVVYLQNSGVGNTVNPLLSLADPDVYSVPMLLVVGWRGQEGVPDEPQHVKQGRVMTTMLDGMDVPWSVLPKDPDDGARVVRAAVDAAEGRGGPFVLLVEKGTFAPAGSTTPQAAPELPSREDALHQLIVQIDDSAAIVATTGMLSRELFELRLADGHERALDFLTVGGMGHASSIALGIALAQPEREVWCLDGDGALLMHMGTLAVVANHRPSNYLHVVFNNGVHDSVGGQPTAVNAVDVPALARAAGYRWAARPGLGELEQHIRAMRASGGPALMELVVRPGARCDLGRPTRTPVASKEMFMAAIGPTRR